MSKRDICFMEFMFWWDEIGSEFGKEVNYVVFWKVLCVMEENE